MDKSILQLALERGLAAGGKLSDELRRLRDYTIRSEADAKAICGALRTVLEQPTAPEPGLFSSPLYNLVTLFQKVEVPESEAFRVLHAGSRF